MKRQYFILILICISLLLNGIAWFNHINKDRGISKEEAERIALEQAEVDGFLSPTLWDRNNTESTLGYKFSVEQNEDVNSWQVNINTKDNPSRKNTPAAIYYISHKHGDVISVINGLQ